MIKNLTLISTFAKCLPSSIDAIIINKSSIIINIKPSKLFIFLNFQKKHTTLQCNTLLDLFGVDYLNRLKRFEIIYTTLSVRFALRLFTKIFIGSDDHVNSSVDIYPSAA